MSEEIKTNRSKETQKELSAEDSNLNAALKVLMILNRTWNYIKQDDHLIFRAIRKVNEIVDNGESMREVANKLYTKFPILHQRKTPESIIYSVLNEIHILQGK